MTVPHTMWEFFVHLFLIRSMDQGSMVATAQWVTKEIANPEISVAKLKHIEMWSSQALNAFNIERSFLLVGNYREHSSACV